MNRISRIFKRESILLNNEFILNSEENYFIEDFIFEEFNVDFIDIYMKYSIDNLKYKCIDYMETNKTNYKNIIRYAPKLRRMDSQRTLC